MKVQEYRDYIAAGNPVVAGSDAHLFLHQMAQEAIRITMEINNKYHTPEELRKLFSELWDIEVPSVQHRLWQKYPYRRASIHQ